jgi:NAD(P)-dependent dehydrogenase (short-subunit alcohol dehydrogenase family)
MSNKQPRRRAVVIGAGSGMGSAVATRFHQDGFELLLADVKTATLEQLAAQTGAQVAQVDIASEETVAALAKRCEGGVDALVITAGLSSSMAPFERIVDVNLGGTARVLRKLAPVMNRDGAAVCFASIAGHLTGPVDEETQKVLRDPHSPAVGERLAQSLAPAMRVSGMAYALSKLGILKLVQHTAVEWGKLGLRVCSVSPGIIDTPMGRLESDANRETVAAALAATPISRRGTPDEVANVAAFLCSQQASYMTGCDIIVDGGWLGAMQSSTEGASLAEALNAARQKG